MDNISIRANDGKTMCSRLHKDDVIEVCVNTLKNPQKKYVGKYLLAKDDPRLIVSDKSEDAIAVIQEHILEMYTLKELWDLFKKVLFRIPKVNNIKFRIIKD